MKAQIHLFLKDDNSFRSIFDGCPKDFAAMLHKCYSGSHEFRLAAQAFMHSVFKDLGDDEVAKKCFDMLENSVDEMPDPDPIPQ